MAREFKSAIINSDDRKNFLLDFTNTIQALQNNQTISNVQWQYGYDTNEAKSGMKNPYIKSWYSCLITWIETN